MKSASPGAAGGVEPPDDVVPRADGHGSGFRAKRARAKAEVRHDFRVGAPEAEVGDGGCAVGRQKMTLAYWFTPVLTVQTGCLAPLLNPPVR